MNTRRQQKKAIKKLKAEGRWEDDDQQTEELHPLIVEPDHSHGELSKSIKNFFIAVVIIIVFSIASVYGLYQLARYFPESAPWSMGQKLSGKKLPPDIPLYNGAVLAESDANGNRMTFRYMLPLGAQTTARSFYETEMVKNEWMRLASSKELLEFYKKEGRRRAVIKILYQNGKATLIFEITGNNAS